MSSFYYSDVPVGEAHAFTDVRIENATANTDDEDFSNRVIEIGLLQMCKNVTEFKMQSVYCAWITRDTNDKCLFRLSVKIKK